MRRRVFQKFLLAGGVCFRAPSIAAFDRTLAKLGDIFFDMFDSGKFSEAAALFHYPESYDKPERDADAKTIEAFLANLSLNAGVLRQRRVGVLAGKFLTIGVGAGDILYWSAHHEFDIVMEQDYVAEAAEGALGFSLNWVNAKSAWKLKSVICNISTSRPDARAFAEKLIKSFPHPVKTLPLRSSPGI